jgi:hypothetical protein
VALELLYGQVIKAYRRRKLAKVEQPRSVQQGERSDLKRALQRLGFTGSIIAALTRRSWATTRPTPELEAHLQSGVPDWGCYPDILQIPIYF